MKIYEINNNSKWEEKKLLFLRLFFAISPLFPYKQSVLGKHEKEKQTPTDPSNS